MEANEDTAVAPETAKIAFITLHQPEPGSYRAGLLVLDAKGVPAEVWITDEIRPNAQQKVLYGRSLERHIAVDLCGTRLVESLRNQPLLMLCDLQDFLGLHSAQLPVIWLQAGDELDVALRSSGLDDGEEGELRTQGLRPIAPIAASGVPPEAYQAQFDAIKPFFDDMLEPFDRIRRAIDEVHRATPKEH